jgi:hypothetical protein
MDFEKIAKTPITEPFDRLVSIVEAHELAILADPLGEYRKLCDLFMERIKPIMEAAAPPMVVMEVTRPDGKIEVPPFDTIRIRKKEYERLLRISQAVEGFLDHFGRL